MIMGLDADTILTPYAAGIANSGIKAVGRYLKNLQPEEIAELHSLGIAIWLIFETGSDNILGGADQGTRDGQRTLSQAQALGVPEGRVAIYATADMDVDASNLSIAEDYWAAFDAVIFGHYQIGGYADGTALSGLRDHGLPYCWLAGAMGWEDSRDFLATGNPTLVQGPTLTNGGMWAPPGQEPTEWPDLDFPYDPDMIMSEDFGAWLPPTAG